MMKNKFENAPGTFENPIIDSELSTEEALRSNPEMPCPPEILEQQMVLPVRYLSFDGLVHAGQLVVHAELGKDVQELFRRMLEEKFPVQSAIPVADPRVKWDDIRSMELNNSSAFNYRRIMNTDRLSNHALGRALDINPRQNPYITPKGVWPAGGEYVPGSPGTMAADSVIVRFLTERGWEWGGSWEGKKDYHHFQRYT